MIKYDKNKPKTAPVAQQQKKRTHLERKAQGRNSPAHIDLSNKSADRDTTNKKIFNTHL